MYWIELIQYISRDGDNLLLEINMEFTLKYYRPKLLLAFVVIITTAMSFLSEYMPNWIPVPTTVAIILGLLILYDKYLWKKLPWLLKIPNISGRYKGQLISSWPEEDKPVEIDIFIEISQTGSGLHIRQFNKNPKTKQETQSYSNIENVSVLPDGNLKLSFGYVNDGEPIQVHLDKHDGFCILDIQKHDKEMNGIYFTNRHPQPTRGKLTATFEKEQTIGRFLNGKLS